MQSYLSKVQGKHITLPASENLATKAYSGCRGRECLTLALYGAVERWAMRFEVHTTAGMKISLLRSDGVYFCRGSSKTFVPVYQTTRQNIRENCDPES
jgi:hypothetical protein